MGNSKSTNEKDPCVFPSLTGPDFPYLGIPRESMAGAPGERYDNSERVFLEAPGDSKFGFLELLQTPDCKMDSKRVVKGPRVSDRKRGIVYGVL